jgi:hypothetical protein
MAKDSLNSALAPSTDVGKIRNQVQEFLGTGRPEEAIKLLSRDDSAWSRNARGVCFLRLGQTGSAVEILRGLVIAGNLNLKPEVPILFKTNFATALLLSGNISGGEGTLDDIRDEQHQEVHRLRTAIQKWKSGMTLWQKLAWWLGSKPYRPFEVDWAPGEIL